MATYRVWNGAAGANNGTSWTDAYTAFGSAVTAATADGDIILVQYTHQEELGASTTYTFAAHVVVVCVDKDSSDVPTVMGTSGWVGHSSLSRAVTMAGAKRVRVYGLTIKTAGGAGITWNNTDGGHFELDSCRDWNSGTTVNVAHTFGNTSNAYTEVFNHTFDVDRSAGADTIVCDGRVEFTGGSFSLAGTLASNFLGEVAASYGVNVVFYGFDFSAIGSGITYIANNTRQPAEYRFINCKLSAAATILATQTTVPNRGSAKAWVYDCHSGDTHLQFAYYDAQGTITSDTGIYFTTGAAAQSWKVVTSANCNYHTPFECPWITFYNAGGSAITPYLEILRDGSTTAYQDDEVWCETLAKTTSGSTIVTEYSDACTLTNKLAGTTADQASGAGTGSWTGEAASAWSGKVDTGSAITPAEVGYVQMRLVVGEPSITVYLDPQPRT